MEKIRKLYRRKNVQDTIEPFFQVWKIFGLSGFSLRSSLFRSDFKDYFYCVIHIIFGIFITYSISGHMMRILSSKVLSITVYLFGNYSILGALLISLVNFATREKNFNLMRKFAEFDNEVKVKSNVVYNLF